MSAGKPLGVAIEAAYNKAFTVIFDANATTLITAAILFWKSSAGEGLCRDPHGGHHCIGVLRDDCDPDGLRLGDGRGLDQADHELHLINPAKQINFMGRRRLWIAISLTVIGVSVVGFAMRGPKNFGIDFRGATC